MTDHDIEDFEAGVHFKTSGHDVHVDLLYPAVDAKGSDGEPVPKARRIFIDQTSVRASDGIMVSYDYDRDGWSIKQPVWTSRDRMGDHYVEVEDEKGAGLMSKMNRRSFLKSLGAGIAVATLALDPMARRYSFAHVTAPTDPVPVVFGEWQPMVCGMHKNLVKGRPKVYGLREIERERESMSVQARLEELRALLAKATPGTVSPGRATKLTMARDGSYCGGIVCEQDGTRQWPNLAEVCRSEANADLIVALVNDAPALLDELEARRMQCEGLTEMCAAYRVGTQAKQKTYRKLEKARADLARLEDSDD